MIVLGYGIHRECTLQYDDLSITAGILPCKSEKNNQNYKDCR